MARTPRTRSKAPKAKATAHAPAEASFHAACGRQCQGPADLEGLAYLELAYPECPDCPARLEPEDAASFCYWRRAAPHPFASLAALVDLSDT